jgi:hypothetical protein
MIPEVRACSIPPGPTSPIGHTERTPGPCPYGRASRFEAHDLNLIVGFWLGGCNQGPGPSLIERYAEAMLAGSRSVVDALQCRYGSNPVICAPGKLHSLTLFLLRRPTTSRIVEDGRFSRPCGPGAHSRASEKTNLRLRRHFHIPSNPCCVTRCLQCQSTGVEMMSHEQGGRSFRTNSRSTRTSSPVDTKVR